MDEDEAAFKEKKKAEADALKAAREKGTSASQPSIHRSTSHTFDLQL